ncbi:diguanylate cyclase [Desulfobulbus propionicus DSM 2032]|uniref:diguanylate cyclase n=1 Tax=Desulfobulbus propionicus (strain ATCC 33891 / DSM 2032 / VKM B-1956 / 1pr3) TaxID=577650 RepID=A0A7U3YLH2_DESPD|nr:GGDEF domain-containing protein [Desulfobulbus propionicus]ADW17583.1 diguanylate cyclase [Desulfobulbus propionicus DSM 2032]
MSTPLNKALNAILSSASLPTLPAVAAKVLEVTSQDDISFPDLTTLIAQDMALSARILKVANSALYCFPQKIGSISQAVSLLGINAVRSLVLSFTFLSMGEAQSHDRFDLNQFWERSLVGATAARLLAEQTGRMDPEEMFTIGLLQDIGCLIFALTIPRRYDRLTQHLTAGSAEVCELSLEEEYIGLTHTISGAEIGRLWALPSPILAAIRYHHDPLAYPGTDPKEDLAIKITHLSALVTRIFFSVHPERFHRQFVDHAHRLLGLEDVKIKTILKIINREIEKSARFFGVNITSLRPVAEIIQEANIRLSLLHLSYEAMHRELTQAKTALEQIRRQLTERNRLLEKLANLDGLTEISNHRFFHHSLHSEINRAIRNHAPLSLLLADIDHFKKFNDVNGHQIGDFILKELCQVAQTAIREYDLMARYGGEEFAFILPETDAEGAVTVARKLCNAIADHDFFNGERHFRVTVSIGAATVRPAETACSKNDLIGMADTALYAAKKLGRNQVIHHSVQTKTGGLRRT